MKKIVHLVLFLFIPFLANATPGPDRVRSWWNSECLLRGPFNVTNSANGNLSLNNATCQAGNTYLDLLEQLRKANNDTTEKTDTQTESRTDHEWKDSVDAAQIVSPAKHDQQSSESTVLGKIRTISSEMSIFGELHTARTLYQKSTPEEVKQKQDLIRAILNNKKLFKKSKEIQKNISSFAVENSTRLFSLQPEMVKHHGASDMELNWLGTGRLLACKRAMDSVVISTCTATFHLFFTAIGAHGLYNCAEKINQFNDGKTVTLDINHQTVQTSKYHVYNNKNTGTISAKEAQIALSIQAALQASKLSSNLLGLGSSVWTLYNSITKSDQYFKKMLPIYIANHKLLNAALSIKELSDQYPELKNMQSFSNIQKLEEKMSKNKNLRETIELLTSNPDNWWAHNKEALVTLLDKHKDELAGIYEVLGEFESYVALAETKNKLKAEGHPITFSEFTKEDRPSLSMKNFWNPLLDHKKAIANSLVMGKNKDNMRHMVLTGSNTGGKSTLLKAVIANTILSQTYGIAFADHMKHTYFDNVLSSLNINDNTADGDSLFMSEVKRAKAILEEIHEGKSLVVFDELFNGTSAQNAGRAAAKVLTQLGKNPNTLSLFATHHGQAVTNLGHMLPFKNYRMDATRESNGKIRYTYKLKPGISTENIADDILKEELGI